MPPLTPPALTGLPLLGNALDFRRDPIALIQRGYEAFGSIFAIRLGPKSVAVVLGPENHRFFFTESGNILSLPEVYKFIIPMFGKILQAAEPEAYRQHRALLQPSFHGKRLGWYAEVMIDETLAWLDQLGNEGAFELRAFFEQLSMYIAATTLMGKAFRQHLGSEFWELYRDLAGGMEFVLPANLPLPRFRRRDRAKVKLHAIIRAMLDGRRVHPEGHNDILQAFLEATSAVGTPVAEETIVNMILLMVFAAYETTATQISWVLIQLLQHPHYLAFVLDEQESVLGSGAKRISLDTLGQLYCLEWAVRESERMRPATTILMRYTAKSYDLGGYLIPQGWLTMVCPSVSHRLPDVFPKPNAYDPWRFSPERAEDRQTPFSLVTFGGGAHKCLGLHFAYLEMKVILSLLLQRYTLELVNPDPRPDYYWGLTRPQAPCFIRYKRHT